MIDRDLDLAELLDELRSELGAAVDELERTRAAHRSVETVLSAVLDHVPTPVVVVDDELRVRAFSAAAEAAWDVRLDVAASSSDTLHGAGVVEALRPAFGAGRVDELPPPFAAVVVVEPGTDARYAVVWSASQGVEPAHG